MPARRTLPTKSVVLAKPSGRISAAANRLLIEGARELFGEAVLAKALREAGPVPEDGSWVAYESHVRLLDALAAAAGPGALARLGEYNAKHVDRVVPGASFLLKFVSPERLLKEAPRIWSTYADFGKLEVVRAGKGRGEIALVGVASAPAFCASLSAFFAGLLSRVGAKKVTVTHTACVIDGASTCRFVGAWA